MAKIIRPRPKGFTQVNNLLIDDSRVSLPAKGLFLTMWRLPNDWRFSIADLAKRCGCGKTMIQSALQELMALGYVCRQSVRQAGRFAGFDYILSDALEEQVMDLTEVTTAAVKSGVKTPGPQEEIAAATVSKPSVSGNTEAGQSTTTNTILTKTISTKNNNNELDIDITRALSELDVKANKLQWLLLTKQIEKLGSEGKAMTLFAIQRMGEVAPRPSIHYLKKILKDYEYKGYRTLNQVQAEKRRFDANHVVPDEQPTLPKIQIPFFHLVDQPSVRGC